MSRHARRHLARQARSRTALADALAGWAALTKATPPDGTGVTVRAVNANGDPVEVVATLHLVPDPTDPEERRP